jgi:hypothetical protein
MVGAWNWSLTSQAHVGVHERATGGYDVAVWGLGDLTAWGHTRSQEDIVATMDDVQVGLSGEDLTRRNAYLASAVDAGAGPATEAQWQLLLRYGDQSRHDVAAAVAADARLRRLRPWISHGTLHLLLEPRILSRDRKGLAFHPAGDGFVVASYQGTASLRLDNINAAVAAAGEMVAGW